MLSAPDIAGADLALSIALGVGLAAAVGFRVFLPLLVMSIAAYFGHLHLSSGFAWLGSAPALLMLSVAAVLEIIAYYIPGVDSVLDALATRRALIAGGGVGGGHGGCATACEVERRRDRRRRRRGTHAGHHLATAP